MNIILTIYIIIFTYFLLGAIGFYFINRKKEQNEARKSRTKFVTYFFIIHILFFSIVFNPFIFKLVSVLIILAGVYELFNLFRNSGYNKKVFFIFSLIYFGIFCYGFFHFSGLQKKVILFSFLVLSIFDSFSQITGQLWGKRKILPKISSQKTVEGLAGGALVALLSVFLLKGLVAAATPRAIMLAAGIVCFAFVGDISASYFKRKYNVKDFSNLIPGHGGFLDRFDSLVAGGAFVALSEAFVNF